MAQELRGLSKVENIYLGEGEGTAVLVGSCPHPRVYISAGHLFTGRGAGQLFVTAQKAEKSARLTLSGGAYTTEGISSR